MAFVYRHIRLDKNEPFYIGIGSRSSQDRAYYTKKRNSIWDRIYQKTEIDVEILFDNISWEEAKRKEIEFIALYGRINTNTGTLANLTDGGDGMLGFKFSDKARKNMSNAQKLKPTISDLTRKKLSIAGKNKPGPWKGKKLSQQHIEKIKIGIKDRIVTKITCPHCNKIGASSPMTRWHFNNCKLKNI